MTAPLAFVSYRRADSSAASRWLADSITRTFGPAAVFIDTEAIRMADDWPDRIAQALQGATLLLPVIGPRWLSIADEDHRRRIDDPGDWVFQEILHALTARQRILPVLLSRTPMPRAGALPPAIAALTRHQAYELRDERWAADLAGLLSEMERFGFVRASGAGVRYPTPQVTLRELTPPELQHALSRLPGWRLAGHGERLEIVRTYEFASFEDAMRFMQQAVPTMTAMQHHPRWENLWRSVTVALTTWDIGHRPSRLDLELASALEDLRSRFPASPDAPAS